MNNFLDTKGPHYRVRNIQCGELLIFLCELAQLKGVDDAVLSMLEDPTNRRRDNAIAMALCSDQGLFHQIESTVLLLESE